MPKATALEDTAQATADRSIRLLALTEALARAMGPEDVAAAAVRFAVEAVDASAAAVSRLSTDGTKVAMVGATGLPDSIAAMREFPLTAASPIADALRRSAPIFLEGLQARIAAYPSLAEFQRRIGHEALAILPLGVDGQIGGAITFYFRTPRTFEADERAFLMAIANQVSQAMERARLFQSEKRASAEAGHLFELTRRLVRAETLDEVLEPAIDALTRLVEVDRASVLLFDPDRVMRFKAWRGLSGEYRRTVEGHTPWTPETPEPKSICVSDVAAESSLSAFLPVFEREGIGALAFVPLVAGPTVVGKLMVYSRAPRSWSESDLRRAETIAGLVAQGVVRLRSLESEREARATAESEQARASFLSEASALLSESLDVDVVLQRTARLAVPRMADWAGVDLFEEESVRRIAVVHSDPAQVKLVEDLTRRYPPDLKRSPVLAAVHAGEGPKLIPEITDEMLVAGARDPEHLALIRKLGLRSFLIVPVTARGTVLGAISFGYAESGRKYGDADVDTAVHLGRRVGLAIENARLLASERAARDAARDADRRKDEFLAMLGHELRNPLAPITTALHLIRLKAPSEIDREISLIDRQVGHLTRLVDDLLDLSRITRGKVQLAKEDVELSEAVQKAIELVGPLLEQRGHRLAVSIPPDLWVHADPVRLAQVFANLVGNAAKYTDPGGSIEIRASVEGTRVEIAVKDNGIGIPPELLHDVFERFVQAAQSTDRAQGGLGIGLALVKSLVELHGGTVSAESAGAGSGSTFRVRLPLTEARADAPRLPVTRRPRTGRPLRVLVVDDIEDVRNPLAELLREHGHEVATATDGPSALAEADRFQPEAAILDIGLPVMDGYELGMRLRAARPDLQLLAVTGYGLDADRERSRASGFDVHFVKPVRPEALLQALEQARSGGQRQ